MKKKFPWVFLLLGIIALGGLGLVAILIVVFAWGDIAPESPATRPSTGDTPAARDAKDDAAALGLAGIHHRPAPKVVFRAYEAGLDDSMMLIFEIPRAELDVFWASTVFADDEREVFPSPDKRSRGPGLPEGTSPEWQQWKAIKRGIHSASHLPDGEFVRIFVDLDHPDVCRCYLFWHQT